MKRFFLLKDIRMKVQPIYYKQYKGWYRKNQKKKWLRLTIVSLNKDGTFKYIKKWQLVRIKIIKGMGVIY